MDDVSQEDMMAEYAPKARLAITRDGRITYNKKDKVFEVWDAACDNVIHTETKYSKAEEFLLCGD